MNCFSHASMKAFIASLPIPDTVPNIQTIAIGINPLTVIIDPLTVDHLVFSLSGDEQAEWVIMSSFPFAQSRFFFAVEIIYVPL
jgi:hypothetical protein